MGAELIGWRCMATFPTGPQRQLRWQDGYVFESGVDLKDGKRVNNYRLFFPIDQQEERVEEPFDDKSICFAKASSGAQGGPRVSAAELAHARAAVLEG